MLTEERKEQLVTEMKEQLEDREYSTTRKALRKIIDEWEVQKNGLIEMFKNHPNWDEEKLMVKFDIDYERVADINEIHRFIAVVQQRIWTLFDESRDNNRKDLLYNLICVLDIVRKVHSHIFKEEDVQQIAEYRFFDFNEDTKKLSPKVGQRVTRFMNKLLSKVVPEIVAMEDYNRLFAAYADAITPLKITRHTVISVNPLDYLLQSHGNSWNSCHYIGDYKDDYYRGCHSSGTISYMLDNTSFVFYTVDSSYNGNEIELEPKISRCMFAYDNFKIIQQRVYPQSTDGDKGVYVEYRNIVQEVVAKCKDIPNFWKTSHDAECHARKGCGATLYPDWEEQSSSCSAVSIFKEKENDCDVVEHEITIGAEPICVYTGERHSNRNTIQPYERCEICGRVVGAENFRNIDGKKVCCNCYFFCSGHSRYEIINETRVADSFGNYFCKEYAEQNFNKCEECGEWIFDYLSLYKHIDENGKKRTFCRDCAEKKGYIKPTIYTYSPFEYRCNFSKPHTNYDFDRFVQVQTANLAVEENLSLEDYLVEDLTDDDWLI